MKDCVLLFAAVVLLGCGREQPPAASGGRSGTSVFPPPGRAARDEGWDVSLGPVIATPSIENGTPLLFVRDTTSTADLEVELFNHDGQARRATLIQLTRRRGCAWERSAVLATTVDRSAPAVWSLALAPGVAKPMAVDGIGDLLPRDSVTLAARIHRLVSALPDDSLSAPFRGLAIVVRDAWQVRLEDSTTITLAITTRALNVESNPRGEVTTIVIEPDPAAGANAWRTAFARRDTGPEDRVEGADLLAAFHMRDARPAVAFVRESDKGLQLDVVERTSPGTWRVRWSSETLPCAR